MKKAVSILLIMVIAFAPLTASASPFDGSIRPLRINTSGLKPAAFSNVEYKIRGDVVRVNSEELLPMIKSEEQIRENTKEVDLTPGEIISNTGYIKDSQLKSIKSDYKLGTVLVDEKNQTAVKINSLPEEVEEAQEFSGYVAVEKPEVYEVLEYFKIPKQTVKLNQSNITAFGEGMEECVATSDNNKKYAMAAGAKNDGYSGSSLNNLGPRHLKDPFIEFKFDKKTFTAYTPSGGDVKVELSGYLGIDSISVDGDYSGFDGYEFYMSTGEEMYLKAVVTAEMKEEVVIPLFGIDVDAKVARVYGGLFLVVGLDGQFTLVAEARQWLMIDKAGIKGGTFCYVPTSFKPLFRTGDRGVDVDASFNGAINGYIKAGPMLGLEIFGWKAAGAGALFGGGAKCVVADGYIDADVYGIVNIYATLLGRTKNLLNWQPVLFHKRQLDMEGYIVTFKEACAFRKIVWGKIEHDYGSDGVAPYTGKFSLVIKDQNGAEKRRYDNKYTDQYGEFSVRDIDVEMKKSDMIIVEVPSRLTEGKIIYSAPINPSFPFRKVVIEEADFFNDYVVGHVPSVIVKDWTTGEKKEIVYDGDIAVIIDGVAKNVKCDQYGNFRLDANVLPNSSVKATIWNGDIVSNTDVKPSVDIVGNRVVIPLEEKTYEENGGRIDSSKEREIFIIYNMNGEKPVLGSAKYNTEFRVYNSLCFIINPMTGRPLMDYMHTDDSIRQNNIRLYEYEGKTTEDSSALKLTPVYSLLLGKKAVESGDSFAVNDFTMEWAWKKEGASQDTTTTIIREPISIRNPVISSNPIIRDPITSNPIKPISPIGGTTRPTLTAPIIKKLPNILPESLIDKDAPQNTESFRYESFLEYKEPSDNVAAPQRLVGYLKRIGTVEYMHEGAKIIISDSKDKDPERESKGAPKYNQETSFDRYLSRMFWSVVSPTPDQNIAIDRASSIRNLKAVPAWSNTSVKNMINKNIMDLAAGQTFKSGNVTRGECAAYIAQAFGLEAKVGKSKFTDIPPMHPYLPQINSAVEAGLISGYSDTKFGTFDSISREQMASIIMRGMKSKYGSRLSITGSAMQFKDMGKINSWAKQSVNEVSALGIMKGSTDGSFNPQGKVTFNEVAVILNNLDTYMQQHK